MKKENKDKVRIYDAKGLPSPKYFNPKGKRPIYEGEWPGLEHPAVEPTAKKNGVIVIFMPDNGDNVVKLNRNRAL